jgi:hypothetical protein
MGRHWRWAWCRLNLLGQNPRMPELGTCCPIEPAKRRESVIAKLAELNTLLVGSCLLDVGGLRPSHTRFRDRMQSCVSDIIFV